MQFFRFINFMWPDVIESWLYLRTQVSLCQFRGVNGMQRLLEQSDKGMLNAR
jgi:hypothetical protein